jgi:ATP-binding cassette subfamily G (WHITE) protein 2 (SNQ2)
MAAEFTGMSFGCDQSRRVPRGPLYQDAPVTCAIPGAEPGEMVVDGGQYLLSYYGFTYSHVWRNVGIILGMSFGYILVTMYFLEHFDWSSGASGASGIERIGKQRRQRAEGRDPENQATRTPCTNLDASDAAVEPPRISSTDSSFTWRNIHYIIPYGNSEKTLLQDVSGYCKPGELTALVGASGAGKSTRRWKISSTKCMLTVIQSSLYLRQDRRVEASPVRSWSTAYRSAPPTSKT